MRRLILSHSRAHWTSKVLWEYDEKKVAISLIARMPMKMWAGSSSRIVSYVDDVFEIHSNRARGSGIGATRTIESVDPRDMYDSVALSF
jgi:hypothetical protein